MYDPKDERVISNLQTFKSNYHNKVVLTFDDGPSKYLPSILDVLEKKEVNAMFFWQSRLLHRKRPWKRVLEIGSIVGSHSSKHLNLTKLSYAEQLHDIKTSVEIIENITGVKVKYFRPPFGQYNENTIKVSQALQLTPILWDITSFDWELKNNPKKIISKVSEHLRAGSIILLHELEQTLAILPELIDEIHELGFKIDIC